MQVPQVAVRFNPDIGDGEHALYRWATDQVWHPS